MAGAVGYVDSAYSEAESQSGVTLVQLESGYRLVAEQAPLSEVIEVLSEQSDVTFSVGAEAGAERVSLNLLADDMESLIRNVAKNYALVYEQTEQGPQLTAARLSSPEEAVPAGTTSPHLQDRGEQTENVARTKKTVSRTAAAPDSRTPEELGLLSNSDRPVAELRSRGGPPAIVMASAILDTEALKAEDRRLPIPERFLADENTEYHIIQFKHELSSDLRNRLEAAGAKVTHYVPKNAYAVKVPAEKRAAVLAVPGVNHVEPYHPYFKMSVDVLKYLGGVPDAQAARRTERGLYNIMMFNGVDGEAALEGVPLSILSQQASNDREILTVSANPAVLETLIAHEDVQWVEPSLARVAMNDLGDVTINGSNFELLHPNLDGEGVIVGVTDSGIDVNHPGFFEDPSLPAGPGNTRILDYQFQTGGPTSDGLEGDTDGHGTHVAGSILGNGALSDTAVAVPGSGSAPYLPDQFKGVAPGAQVVMIEDFNSFSDTEQAEITYDSGARLSNNSWGNSFHQYGTLSATWDALVRDSKPQQAGNQEVAYFFAAGNDGGGSPNGVTANASTVGEPGNAKNVITVGAVEQARFADNRPLGQDLLDENDSRWQVASFSSRGPVTATDARVKPDIVAPGTYVLSTQSQDLQTSWDDFSDPFEFEFDVRNGNVDTGPYYAFLSGTSMATPLTTGAGALIYQYMTENLGRTPSPALMKAALVAGGRNLNTLAYSNAVLGAELPIVHQGWGRVDVVKSVDGPRIQSTDQVIFLDQNEVNPVDTGETFSYPITVQPGQGGIKIVMAWTEPPGTPGTGLQLINDIDLLLRAEDGSGYAGNFYSSDGFHSEELDPLNAAFADEMNNVETILVPDLAPGDYTIEVFGWNVPQGPQDFALAIQVGQPFVGPNYALDPDMVLDGQDNPVVAYSQLDAGGFEQIFLKVWRGDVRIGSDALGVWKLMKEQWFGVAGSTTGTGISRTVAPSRNPSVAVDGRNIFVAWEQQGNTTGTPTRIYFRQFDGTDWVELGNSARGVGLSIDNGYTALNPVVGVADDGRPVVAWQQNYTNGAVIAVKKWTGSAWEGLGTSATTGVPGSISAGRPVLEVDSQGRIALAWEEYTDRRVRVRRWNGSVWEAFLDVGYNWNAQQPDIAIGSDDSIYIAYQQFPDFTQGQLYTMVLVAKSAGFGWTGIGFLGNSYIYPGISGPPGEVGTPIRPHIDVNDDDVIMVSYQDGQDTNNAIIVKEFNGFDFSGVAGAGAAPGVASTGGDLSIEPIIKVDSLGVPVVMWEHFSGLPNQFLSYTLVTDRQPPQFAGLSTAAGDSSGNVNLSWPPAFDPSAPITYSIYQGATSFACGTTPACDAQDVFAGTPIGTTTGTTFQVTGLADGQVYCFGVRATDSTGLEDENTVVRSAGPISGSGDLDADCLDNGDEQAIGTDVCIPDTDGDGMWDGWEWAFSTNNPAFPVSRPGLDPLDNGTDKVNTLAANDGTAIQSPNEDLDGDGASNLEEFEWWLNNAAANCDVANTSPDPTVADTDGDNMADGWEIFNDLDPTDPSDGGLDPDMDGLDNSEEFAEGGDPANPDSDGDGVRDGDEVADGTLVNSADTDGDGLDDGYEKNVLGTNAGNWDSNGSGLSDGDAFQLGFDDPTAAFTNWNFLACWDFETPASRAGWVSEAPNPAAPVNLWHVSTADPDADQSSDGILEVDERTAPTAFRLANDPSTTNALATYNFGNQQIINELTSPPFDASAVTTNLFVEWNEYVDTEQDQDLTRVFAIAEGDVLPTPVSGSVSGQGEGWVHRIADMSEFAGRTNVQIVFRFQTSSGVDQNFTGWWVDDVCVYQSARVSGWVRDTDGQPVDDAVVIAIGRGGVTNAVNGHQIVKPGKIFGIAETGEDGSYDIPGLPQGQYYLKADSPVYRAEFWNGTLMTSSNYVFGGHLNPGVPARDLVGPGGILDLTAAAASGEANFELQRGSARACLGVTASGVYPVTVNGESIEVWNGVNTPAGASLVPYQTDPAGDLSNQMPDWITNPIQPNLMCDLAAGPHIPYAQGLGVLYPAPQLDVREGEITRIRLTTEQAVGRLFVEAEDGGNYPIIVDGQATGFSTPANIPISAGRHYVQLRPVGWTDFVGLKIAEVPIGNRVRVTFTTDELFGTTGDFAITAKDIFGSALTGAVVYVNDIAVTASEVTPGSPVTTPTTVIGLLPGQHAVRVELDGYKSPAFRVVKAGDGSVVPVTFTLFQADRDYDGVGDRAEAAGYTNLFLFSRDDDPDMDGLSNLTEFEQFAAHGITLDIFSDDTDGDLMLDGEELAVDGVQEYLASSILFSNAAAQTPTVQVTFKGRYLDGVDFFENGEYVAAIDCDLFDALSLTHSTLVLPNETNAATILEGIPAAIEDLRVNPSHAEIEPIYADTLPHVVDTDGDGMWDGFEKMFDSTFTNVTGVSAHLNPIACGRESEDPDGDGLSNLLEFLGADGLANTNDFLDPTDFDSDDDGMPDGFEIEFGFDPLNPADAGLDLDGDQLTNLEEFIEGTSPDNPDTDGDFLPDGAELVFDANPNSIDTDGDGLIDGREVWDRDLDGVFDGGFFNVPGGTDFDGDLLQDGPQDWDSDGDGMPDGFEVLDPSFGQVYTNMPANCQLDPLDPSDAALDCDLDGLSNLEEYLVRDAMIGSPPLFFDPTLPADLSTWLYPTDPFNPDTDGDGLPDGFEVFRGLHPQDPSPNTEDMGRTFGFGGFGSRGDLDGDGLWNTREFEVRFALSDSADPYLADDLSTHPWIPDTDGDGLWDGEEDRVFRTNPTQQDTDGDLILDGANVTNTMGEVESLIRTNGLAMLVTNHFDAATNDLWLLTWNQAEESLPRWELVVPTDPTAPGPRWGSAAHFVPVNDWSGSGFNIDNRSVVVFGGQDGVTKYQDIWQYFQESGRWFRLSNAGDTNLMNQGVTVFGVEGLSEMSHIALYRNKGTSIEGCPARPGAGNGNFTWHYVATGWDQTYTYQLPRETGWFKSSDFLESVELEVESDASKWEGERLTIISSSSTTTVSSVPILLDDIPIGGVTGIPVGDGWQLAQAPVVTTNGTDVITNQSVDVWNASGFHFTFPTNATFGEECQTLARAELIFEVLVAPTNDLAWELTLEVGSLSGLSAEDYDFADFSNPLGRLDPANYFNTTPALATIPGGTMGTYRVDVTPQMQELLAGPFVGTNFGVVAISASPESAVLSKTDIGFEVEFVPIWRVIPNGDNLEPYWETTARRHFIQVGTQPRKSAPMAYDYERNVAVQFGGIQGNDILDQTIEGTFTFNNANDPEVVEWTIVDFDAQADVPEPRYAHCFVFDEDRDRFVLFGGFNQDHDPLNDLWAYDPAANTWTEITDFLDTQRPMPRGGASMIFWGGTPWDKGGAPRNDQQKMVLFGGTDGETYFNDTWVLDFTPQSQRENLIFDTATKSTRWRLAVAGGEHGQVGPTPRAFASMSYAHNAVAPRIGNSPAVAGAYLFGGRTGTLPTATDTDDDKVDDGMELALGGSAAGRDPRINALTTTNNLLETIPYVYTRIGTPDSELTVQDDSGPSRGAIASLEALSWVDQGAAPGPQQGRPVEVFAGQPANQFSFSGVDGWQADFVEQWYHRFSLEQPNDPRDVWELGVPDNSIIGETAGPPYAYRGRWVYGTDLNGTYPNQAVMELYSPLVDIVLPPVGATDTNGVTTSYYLSFYEWLDLADANDIVRIDLVKPVTPADVLRREHGDVDPPPIVLGNRNNAFNTQGEWRRQVVPLDILGQETNVYFRFTMSTDSEGVGGGWYIDDVALFQAAEVSGVLTNSAGDPVPGMQVNLLGENFNQTVLDTTVTGPDGSYQFGPLPFGNYQVGLGGNIVDLPLSSTNASPQVSAGITVLITGTSVTPMGSITWPSIPGMNYVVEYTEDLSPTGQWFTLTTITAADLFTTYQDPNGTVGMRFYRVRLLLQ